MKKSMQMLGGTLAITSLLWLGQSAPSAARPAESSPSVSSIVLAQDLRGEEALQIDVYVSDLVSQQDQLFVSAGQLMEDCLYGRCSFSMGQKRIGKLQEDSRQIGNALQAYKAKHPNELSAAALRLCEQRQSIIDSTAKLINRGDVERSQLKGLQIENDKLVQVFVSHWLNAKLSWAKKGVKNAPNSKAKDYYSWQLRVIPLQKNLCLLNARLLALSASATDGSRPSASESTILCDNIAKQTMLLKRIHPPSSVFYAHNMLVSEAVALGNLAEAVALLGKDLSPDSSSRINRCHDALRQRSQAASKAAMAALRDCLPPVKS